uniref:Gastrin/cholecystokinin type B receptor n=1 Tax=Graphocephala atropunctata TaxID=36148 RepID=A0A1B6LSS3_9HEMI
MSANLSSTYPSSVLWWEVGKLQILLYSTIFLLAVVGNCLVILTLIFNQTMRTITNVFLLNLAVSDLLLGVLCMPFTLIGTILRDFVFGDFMCKLIPFLQACSVSVSAWTLVVISVERYYAICHPLRSRRWQTLSHAYRMIVAIWMSSLFTMAPIAYLSQLIPTNQGHRKCREIWPTRPLERVYNILLDALLLVLPLVGLTATYSLITHTLWKGMQLQNGGQVPVSCSGELVRQVACLQMRTSLSGAGPGSGHWDSMRRSITTKALTKKKRVVKMLFAVVLEFFICWTPLYVINTVALFEPAVVYNALGFQTISYFQLLAYCSSCCNPITYCFMNSSFRQAFLKLFRCFHKDRTKRTF